MHKGRGYHRVLPPCLTPNGIVVGFAPQWLEVLFQMDIGFGVAEVGPTSNTNPPTVDLLSGGIRWDGTFLYGLGTYQWTIIQRMNTLTPGVRFICVLAQVGSGGATWHFDWGERITWPTQGIIHQYDGIETLLVTPPFRYATWIRARPLSYHERP